MSAERSGPEDIEHHPSGRGPQFSDGASTYQTEFRYVRPDGEAIWSHVSTSIVNDPKRQPDAFAAPAQGRSERRRGDRAERARFVHQSALAELSGRALAGIELDVLIMEAVEVLVKGLATDCGVLFEMRGLDEVVVVAGVGCPRGPVDVAHVTKGRYAQAQYTLGQAGPVVVGDLRTETRFSTATMVKRGLMSGLSVAVIANGAPYGVLAAYARTTLSYSDEDIHFTQAVANVVGMAIERHRHAEAAQRAHQRERLAAVGQLAAGVAHDFNNIVAAISLYAELLETQQHLDDAGRGYVEAVRQQVDRGTSLVWQVLDFAHRSSLELVDFDVAGYLEQLVPLLRRTLPEEVRLDLQHDGAGYPVRADSTRLQQIFMNLVSNAKHAIEGAGQVSITLFRHGVDTDEASPHENPLRRPSIRIDIADTGAGMSPDVLRRAFEPFFTTKSPGEGTGLGLAQVHGLVEQHEGHIDLSSALGAGTRVSIWLPAPETTTVTPRTTPPDIPRGRGERVLVVDDDPAMLAAMARVLNWLGYTATMADSGEVACSILATEGNSIAAVLSDVKMPGMGGETLAQAVAGRWPDTPVILVTGYPIPRLPAPVPGPARPGKPALPSPLIRLQKPFSSRQLAEAIKTALPAS